MWRHIDVSFTPRPRHLDVSVTPRPHHRDCWYGGDGQAGDDGGVERGDKMPMSWPNAGKGEECGEHGIASSRYATSANFQTGSIPGISDSEFRAAADIGLSTWNNDASGGYFTLVGATESSNLPNNETLCNNDNIDYSVIRIVDGPLDNPPTNSLARNGYF